MSPKMKIGGERGRDGEKWKEKKKEREGGIKTERETET